MDDSLKTIQTISNAIKGEIQRNISAVIKGPSEEGSLWIEIPDSDKIDLTTQDLAKLVVQTANNYSRAARFNGMMKAELAKAEGLFKARLKQEMDNDKSNAIAREGYAYKVVEEDHNKYLMVKYIAEISQATENGARVASESARKLLDKNTEIRKADNRHEYGDNQ